MSQQPMSPTSTLPSPPATRTSHLLACGVVAGPLFLIVGLAQALTRSAC